MGIPGVLCASCPKKGKLWPQRRATPAKASFFFWFSCGAPKGNPPSRPFVGPRGPPVRWPRTCWSSGGPAATSRRRAGGSSVWRASLKEAKREHRSHWGTPLKRHTQLDGLETNGSVRRFLRQSVAFWGWGQRETNRKRFPPYFGDKTKWLLNVEQSGRMVGGHK